MSFFGSWCHRLVNFSFYWSLILKLAIVLRCELSIHVNKRLVQQIQRPVRENQHFFDDLHIQKRLCFGILQLRHFVFDDLKRRKKNKKPQQRCWAQSVSTQTRVVIYSCISTQTQTPDMTDSHEKNKSMTAVNIYLQISGGLHEVRVQQALWVEKEKTHRRSSQPSSGSGQQNHFSLWVPVWIWW